MTLTRKALAVLLLITACLAAAGLASPAVAASAGAPAGRNCNSADLRYPFRPGGPRSFGVFSLRILHGRCATAHRVAEAWMIRFETAFRAGHLVLPRSVAGFRFTTLPAHVAQTFRERGQARSTTIWFDYQVPNG
jgi:hypothetical protein